MRLLEYWRREAEAQSKAIKSAGKGSRPVEDIAPEWVPPDENVITAQFASMPRANAQQVGVDQNISRMPEELREMVRWAEDFKQKHTGLN